LNWRALKNLNLTIFKNNLYIQGLQSIIRLQADQITELKKDKEYWKIQYDYVLKEHGHEQTVINAPLDDTPLDDPEHWKPLREATELPSEKRSRLEKKYAEKARLKKVKEEEMEA